MTPLTNMQKWPLAAQQPTATAAVWACAWHYRPITAHRSLPDKVPQYLTVQSDSGHRAVIKSGAIFCDDFNISPAVQMYDPLENPTRLSITYTTPRKDTAAQSNDIRKAEIFVNNRSSELDGGTFTAWETFRQVCRTACSCSSVPVAISAHAEASTGWHNAAHCLAVHVLFCR